MKWKIMLLKIWIFRNCICYQGSASQRSMLCSCISEFLCSLWSAVLKHCTNINWCTNIYLKKTVGKCALMRKTLKRLKDEYACRWRKKWYCLIWCTCVRHNFKQTVISLLRLCEVYACHLSCKTITFSSDKKLGNSCTL